jgi:hypothetical protein
MSVEDCSPTDLRCYTYDAITDSYTLKSPGHTTLVDGRYFDPSHPLYAINQKCSHRTSPDRDLMIRQEKSTEYKWDDMPPVCTDPVGATLSETQFLSDEELATRLREAQNR